MVFFDIVVFLFANININREIKQFGLGKLMKDIE